jgi:hypothetical protein
MRDRADDVADDVLTELRRACAAFPRFASAHEAYAVLLEEIDELWDEVKKRPTERRDYVIRAEAIQVAAMAIRFVLDVCDAKEST